ncbi:hypothetical protein SAMN04487969_12552 [Paenibacillus algorifonticola]|uniref:Antigen I/II N-terminal domain-containing protein n=1 Tax=Paenibacillus algorifonticola TaxID=684063 RepID=A0A1I2HQ62_9BACL|nr:hypothetical protein [Paenibacillus algorifonticola]SFF31812.1 hypothetical protein SAMN04487969_12552 [Paenibacillus algorifonticola]
MKKINLWGATALIVCLSLAGCSQASTTNQQAEAAEVADTNQQTKSIEVDKGLLQTEITLPASMFKDQDMDSITADAKKSGIDEITKNADGSVTYKMSKAAHKELMKKAEEGMLQTVEDLKSGNDFASIKDVEHNKAFSEFTFIVDQKAYESSFDAMANLGIGAAAMSYQALAGVSTEELKVTINIQDESTGTIFDTIIYPDALNEMSGK